MPPIVTSAEIERPAAEVFAYATDPTRFSEWQKGVVDGHMDSPGSGTQAPAVGAKCVTTRRIGGASRPATAELVHIDPQDPGAADGPPRSTQGDARQHDGAQAEDGSGLSRHNAPRNARRQADARIARPGHDGPAS